MKNFVEKINTPVMVLRKLYIRDAAELQSLLVSNKENMLPWIPWAKDEPESVEVKKEKIRRWNGEFLLDQKYVYGACNKENKLIGLFFLFSRQGDGILEIGYIIDKEQSGHGFATLGSYALTKLAFEHIQIEKVVIHVNPKNKGSARIPEKLGYNLECVKKLIHKEENGQREEQMIWAMFIEEFSVCVKYEPVNFELPEGW
jgi:RimJ/RimL family protein N-acetyltransferase